ncbi:contractile injection system tape measure protein [Flavobacterium sp. J27]|uniref:contractile injection system tape measure protein n=1 Tax=Flavobacterium sp. J27 TaxID=2060419 RepID=UPI001031BBFA|nr:contractile injection system tape measure protein [Flavobacterium sp. J27]
MNQLNHHIISKLQWQNSFDQKEKAMELQQRVSQWSHTKMQQEIARVFDTLCPDSQTWSISSLTLDLGVIDYDHLEEDLALKLTQQLQDTLFEIITNAEKRKNNIEISDTNVSQISLLKHYFLTGLMSWNFKSSDHSINQMLAKQFKNNKQSVLEMLYKVGVVDENVRKRMAWQLHEPNIIKIIEGLERSNHTQIINFSEELSQIQQQQPLVPANKKDFKRNLWFWILNYLFTDRGTIFNKVAFMKSSILQMSNHYNVAYTELLHLIELAINQVQVNSSTKADFIVILSYLTKENDALIVKENSSFHYETDYWEVLTTLFKSPTLRKEPSKKIEFNDLIHTLSREDKTRFKTLFSSFGDHTHFWHPIVLDLEKPTMERIFQAIIPAQSSLLIESIYFIEKLYKEMNVKLEALLLWEIGIQFILEYKNTPFDNKTFLNYTIIALGKKNNNLKEVIYDQLPHVKVPSSSKTIVALEIYTNLTSILKEEVFEKRKILFPTSFIALLEELALQIKTNTTSTFRSITIQKEIVKYIQLHPKEAFEVLQQFKNKTTLQLLFPYILSKQHIHLFVAKIALSKIELLQIIAKTFKENQQSATIVNLSIPNSNKLYRLGIELIILHSEQTHLQFLEMVLEKLFLKLTPSQKLAYSTFITILFKQDKIQAIANASNSLEKLRLQLFQQHPKSVTLNENKFQDNTNVIKNSSSTEINSVTINGQTIAVKKLLEWITLCISTTTSKVTVQNILFSFKKIIETALEINAKEVLKIIATVPITPKNIHFLQRNVNWYQFSLWIAYNSNSVLQEELETLRIFSNFMNYFTQSKLSTKIEFSLWEITLKIIKQETHFQNITKKFITHWLDQMIKEEVLNANDILKTIQKNTITIDPVLKNILMEYNTTFSKITLHSNTTFSKEMQRCEAQGLMEELFIVLLTERKIPHWFSNTENATTLEVFHEALEYSPTTFIVVYKHNRIPQLQKQQLYNWMDFKKTMRVINEHYKGKQQLYIIERLYHVMSQIVLKGITAKEIQEILFKKILIAWTENNWSILLAEHIWQELLWETYQKKNILKKEFLNAIEKVKHQLPPALQISFDQLVKTNSTTTTAVPSISLKIEKKMDIKSSVNEINSSPIVIKNAGVVLLNNYIEMLMNRLGLLNENQFKDIDSQLKAVHYLQYVVTGLSTTEEVFLPLNKVLCGLQITTPIMESISITEGEKNLIEGLIKAVISYWSIIGETSINGFRGNWLVRDGLLLEKEDRWELTVEKRAYDILINQSPFSFSIIKYPWMEKPLHVTWPY